MMHRQPVTIGQFLSPRETGRIKSGPRGWLDGIFGCSHKDMSRPFSRDGETYRVCLACGARRQFVESTWESTGPFYYGAVKSEEVRPTPSSGKPIHQRPKLVSIA